MKKISAALATAGASLVPFVAFAGNANIGYFTSLANQVTNFLGLLTPIIFALAIIYFFWGLAKFILAAGDEEARAQGKSIMIWGVVAIFVMISVYGLVTLLGSIVGVSNVTTVTLPSIPQTTGR